MRICYQGGKLYLSLTRNEVKEANENVGMPLQLDIGNLKVLHEDISQAVLQHWNQVDVVREVVNLKRCTNK
jgi:hypothetical protein